MALLFGRAARVTIANPGEQGVDETARQFARLRIRFKIERDTKQTPNKSEIIITNLSADSRAQIREIRTPEPKGTRPMEVTLEAGYGTDLHVLSRGNPRTISHGREGADWETRIQCGDGEHAYLHATSRFSFGPGVSVWAVIDRLVTDLGVGRGNFDLYGRNAFNDAARNPTGTYPRGYTCAGQTSKELTKVLRAQGLEWSVQNGELLVVPRDASTSQAFLLNAGTGLVGSPEYGEVDPKRGSYLKVRTLLLPELRPGGLVQLDAEETKGLVRIEKMTATGDTHGRDWYCDLEVKRV